jgi:tetratricopeptide (TPR) repeat protein/transcriptional regulator with XRE-family HTH domain
MASTATVQTLPFGALLKRYRRAAGLSQEALAERAGYSVGHISKLERSARLPAPATVDLLADTLALDASERAALRRTVQRQSSSRRVVFLHSGAPSPPPPPPLVDRSHELAHLERQLAGHGRPVLLFAGEPGIGKTRLLQEAAERGQSFGWCVLESGNRRAWREGFYAPVLGALEAYVRTQPPARLRSSLQGCAWLVRLLPELVDLAGVPMPSWTLPPEQERRLLFSAVERFLTNVASPAGTLLVLDDLQWADADGIDLLGALADGERPLRIVGAYRDTEVGPDSHLAALLTDLARHRLAERVVLGPLTPEAAAALLDGLLEGVEQGADGNALREAALRKARGVPFYAVCFAEGQQSSALEGTPAEKDVPWDIAQTIRQRLAVLPPCAQRVVQIAAVAGQTSSRTLLVRVATQLNCEEAEALAGLDAACQAHLLMEEGDDAYAFANDLIQDVVESDLGIARRTQLHLEVARALERAAEAHDHAPLAGELAAHYTAAGDSEKALPYLQLVAVRAEAVHANAAAAAHYRTLVEQLEALGRTAEATSAREHLGMALFQLGQYDPALAALEQAVEAYRRAGEYEGAGRVALLIGWVHSFRGTIDQGIGRLEQELLGAVQRSPGGSAALYVGLAHLYSLCGRYTDQLDAAGRAAHLASVAEDRRVLSVAEELQGSALDMLGRLAESLEVLESRAIPLARALGDPWLLAQALTRAGSVHLLQGAFEAAIRYAEEALAVAERLDDAELTAYMVFRRARIAYVAGDWDRAVAASEHAARVVRRGRATWWTPAVLVGLGELRLRKGQIEQASADIAEGLALGEQSGDLDVPRWAHGLLAERDLLERRAEQARAGLEPLLDRPGQQERSVTGLLPLLAQAYLELGDVGQAQALAASSVARADAAGLRLALPDALRAQALVALRQRRWESARDTLEDALALSRAMGYPYAEAKGLYVYGLLHQQKGEREQAAERLMAAQTILNRLGERFYAEHVEQALAERERK